MPQVAPYGSWQSPISAAMVGAGNFRVSNFQLKVDGAAVYWTDARPQERGSLALMRCQAHDLASVEEVTPPDVNVRTAVHEYGGGAFAVKAGVLVYVHFGDQTLYRLDVNQNGKTGEDGEGKEGGPRPLTQREGMRYADMELDLGRGRVISVREDHTGGGHEPVNTLVSVSLDGDDAGTVLVEGADFYAAPRLSPDGRWLAYLAWRHPNMPWDGCELWLAEVGAEGTLGQPTLVAGGPSEAIFQPAWSPAGVLHFVSDRSGWWNLYRWRDGQTEALCPMEAEFGLPQWAFGIVTYDFLAEDRLVCAYGQQGVWRLATLDTTSGEFTPVPTPYTEVVSVRASGGTAFFAAGSPTETPAVVVWDSATGKLTTLYRPVTLDLDPGALSIPEVVEFPTEGGLTAYGFFYPPTNRDYVGPADTAPPLLVLSHGGPTGQTSAKLDLNTQFWTSRGFGVLDVNYGGSTGFGRAYRERLNGQWGVVDVDDCCNGALTLARQGRADPNRLIIRGGSAGGYTTLCALTFRNVFKAGASYYGIGDQELLDATTHKFESRYNHSMIGPYPERRDVYQARSPLRHVGRLACPIIFFQGGLDKIVTPDQAEAMVAALRDKGIPVAYILFEDEGHGFRRAENVQRALEAELYFYSRIFGFALPEAVAPVTIENFG